MIAANLMGRSEHRAERQSSGSVRRPATTAVRTPATTQGSVERKRRSPQVVEVRVVVEVQMPAWMQPFQQQIQQQVQLHTPPEIRATMAQQQFVPEFIVTQSSAASGGQPPVITSTRPIVQTPPAAAIEVSTTDDSLVVLYKKHLEPGELAKNEAKTVRADVARIQKFQDWLDSCALRSTYPQRAYLQRFAESKDLLADYAQYIRSQDSGCSSATVSQALNAILKLARWAVENGQLKKLPKYPTRGDVNMMRLEQDECEFSGEPVTVPELNRMLAADVLAGCTWPELGNVSPARFWECVLLSHYCLGFRSQDWFASRTTEKQGLMWSDVITETQCPRLDDLHNPHGWCWYVVHKTKKKSQRAAKPVKLLVPLSGRLREIIELFRGAHPERVFPLPCNGRYWSKEFQGILLRAGLDDSSRVAMKRPSIELSLGQKAVASFRKGCASMWAGHVSESAASYLLQHSVTDGAVSTITREHYLQVYRPLRAIVPALETLPIW